MKYQAKNNIFVRFSPFLTIFYHSQLVSDCSDGFKIQSRIFPAESSRYLVVDGKKNLLIDPKLTKMIKDDAAIVYKLLQKLVIFKVDQFRTILTKSWKLA